MDARVEVLPMRRTRHRSPLMTAWKSLSFQIGVLHFLIGCGVEIYIANFNKLVTETKATSTMKYVPPTDRNKSTKPAANVLVDPVRELYETMTRDYLSSYIDKHGGRNYANASPFPHVVIDNLFPQSILDAVAAEIPESDITKRGCAKGASMCFTTKTDNKKSQFTKEGNMGYHTRALFAFIKSSQFVHFLERLSGISKIVPDPHFSGSGIHMTSPGGSLGVHADFNWNNKIEMTRRVNTFIYLNPDWPEAYGGHLELWSQDMRSCVQRILPKMGRFVVFSSTDFSYHGHPEPLNVPKGRARRSIAMYYYTRERPKEECVDGNCAKKSHGTLFQTPVGCEKCLEGTCNAVTQ